MSLSHEVDVCHLNIKMCFPTDLEWKYRNRKRDFGTKKMVMLKEMYFI